MLFIEHLPFHKVNNFHGVYYLENIYKLKDFASFDFNFLCWCVSVMLDVLLLCYLKCVHRVEMLAPPIVVHRRINIVNTIMIVLN